MKKSRYFEIKNSYEKELIKIFGNLSKLVCELENI